VTSGRSVVVGDAGTAVVGVERIAVSRGGGGAVGGIAVTVAAVGEAIGIPVGGDVAAGAGNVFVETGSSAAAWVESTGAVERVETAVGSGGMPSVQAVSRATNRRAITCPRIGEDVVSANILPRWLLSFISSLSLPRLSYSLMVNSSPSVRPNTSGK
jgi:hypothetical protein